MTDDSIFRLAILVVMALFTPLAAYHRIRSNQTREKLDRRQEGTFILFGLRLGAIPMLLSFLAWMIDPAWMEWAALPFPAWLRWCGIAFLVGWGLLMVWTFQHLGKNLTDTVVTRKDHTLVISGPYRYVRHPFYVSFALAVLGVSLATANWFFFLAGVTPLAFIVARTPIEEAKLVERFGGEYLQYMRKVGRFVPRLRNTA